MIRSVTQILMGLMLLFGALTLAPKMLLHFRMKNIPRALYFMALTVVSLLFAVAAFYYAGSGIGE
ncbi:MAG: hypothetical protein K8I29_05930 [Alphaproteobacteria bacterium]|uniref:Uncharacterized protein n=1 Tax=Candidatus Nitrobium versatile TaxID=2884831 RepID=A0A953J3T5_9BACT|nr:hypothetical protein [Candidatus Nitrobium versatile]